MFFDLFSNYGKVYNCFFIHVEFIRCLIYYYVCSYSKNVFMDIIILIS